jgi:HK97 family phage major capsid protein
MASTDVLLTRLQQEADERNAFIDGLAADAERGGRDLNETEMGLITRARERLSEVQRQMAPLADAARVQGESREMHAAIAADAGRRQQLDDARRTGRLPDGDVATMYRSAGAYAIETWRAALGDEDAKTRLGVFRRAAAHQTTADNLGIIPEPIVGGVLNYIDAARPVVSALGPQPVPGGRFTRPRVTQHTDVAVQAGEKQELTSRKMVINDIPVLMSTYGGYVNVSRQNMDWSTPSIMDTVINDLAAQYAIETESVTGAQLIADGVAGPTLPATPTSADISAALWTAAASAYSALQGQGRLILAVSPDMLGLVGPLFAPVNPTNAQSTGFSAGAFGSGAMGAISGISVIMSAQLPAKTMIVVSSAAVEVYEQRIGSLQVTEPSVLGVQVAYAGYFSPVTLESDGIVKIVVP